MVSLAAVEPNAPTIDDRIGALIGGDADLERVEATDTGQPTGMTRGG
jgi:hypothetical protein